MNNPLAMSTWNKFKRFCALIFSRIRHYFIYFYDAPIERENVRCFCCSNWEHMWQIVFRTIQSKARGLDLPTFYRQSYSWSLRPYYFRRPEKAQEASHLRQMKENCLGSRNSRQTSRISRRGKYVIENKSCMLVTYLKEEILVENVTNMCLYKKWKTQKGRI